MAALDTSIAFSKKDITSITLTFGDASTLVLILKESTLSWNRTGTTYADVKENGQHLSTPQARITEDGTCSGSLDIKIASWLGSAVLNPYEALTWTGAAAAKTTVGAGDKKMVKMAVVYNSTGAGGGSQTVTFRYCVFEAVDIKDSNGLIVGTFNFVDKETDPLIA